MLIVADYSLFLQREEKKGHKYACTHMKVSFYLLERWPTFLGVRSGSGVVACGSPIKHTSKERCDTTSG